MSFTMNNNPLLSILMPTYNHEKFIAQAIESVLMQRTDFEYELLIAEDCSKDRTKDIVVEYQKKYSDRINLLLQDKNIGMHKNFAGAYRVCRGKYIALLEGDDYWTTPYKLQKQIDFLERNNDFSICFHNMQITYEDKPQLNHKSNRRQKQITTIKDLACGNYIYTASCIFRKKLHEMPSWFYQCPIGDYPLHLLNAQYGKIKFIDEVMGVYRIHRGGVWENRSLSYRLEEWIKMLESIRTNFSEEINQILNNSLCNFSFTLAKHCLRNGDFDRYNFYLRKLKSNSLIFSTKLEIWVLNIMYFLKTHGKKDFKTNKTSV
ncbi:glycosyltransferase [bacterium]|nr:glycosyltransferase [bacterium]